MAALPARGVDGDQVTWQAGSLGIPVTSHYPHPALKEAEL